MLVCIYSERGIVGVGCSKSWQLVSSCYTFVYLLACACLFAYVFACWLACLLACLLAHLCLSVSTFNCVCVSFRLLARSCVCVNCLVCYFVCLSPCLFFCLRVSFLRKGTISLYKFLLVGRLLIGWLVVLVVCSFISLHLRMSALLLTALTLEQIVSTLSSLFESRHSSSLKPQTVHLHMAEERGKP